MGLVGEEIGHALDERPGHAGMALHEAALQERGHDVAQRRPGVRQLAHHVAGVAAELTPLDGRQTPFPLQGRLGRAMVSGQLEGPPPCFGEAELTTAGRLEQPSLRVRRTESCRPLQPPLGRGEPATVDPLGGDPPSKPRGRARTDSDDRAGGQHDERGRQPSSATAISMSWLPRSCRKASGLKPSRQGNSRRSCFSNSGRPATLRGIRSKRETPRTRRPSSPISMATATSISRWARTAPGPSASGSKSGGTKDRRVRASSAPAGRCPTRGSRASCRSSP